MSASSSNSHSNHAVEAESSRNPYESPYLESPVNDDRDGDVNPHTSSKSNFRTSSAYLPSPLSTSRSPSPAYDHDASNLQQRRVSSQSPVQPTTANILSYLNTSTVAQDAKDPSALDWYVEGPGRRVGYDNLTAIDWIFEYAKERQRLRVLRSNAVGLLGYFQLLADSSQTWIILVATGIAVGTIAAAIDITSGWLGDLKAGYCSNVKDGGKFYLNKGFCCWGQKDYETCPDWQLWSQGMGVSSSAGSWIVNFVLYLAYSVCPLDDQRVQILTTSSGPVCVHRDISRYQVLNVRQAKWYTRDQDCPWRLRHSSFHGHLDLSDQVYRLGKFAQFALILPC